MVWISYRADQISKEDLERLSDVARDYRDDVILSPRPQNTEVASIVSWGRRMKIEVPAHKTLLAQFIETNRNRSPEPGMR